MKKLDQLHFNFNKIDGYNKPFNMIVSPREDGKTTSAIIQKVYSYFKKTGNPSIFLRFQIADITELYLDSLIYPINKFVDENVSIKYSLSALGKDSCIKVKIDNKAFIIVMALSTPMQRLKSLFIKGVKYIFLDEFILNTRIGEKYPKKVVFRFKEIYNTFQRESPETKFYAMGNPYSFYNPFFVEWGISPKNLKRNKILSGDNWAVDYHSLNEELKEKILEKNPLYKFEDDYLSYALDGRPVNDDNIKLGACPQGFKLDTIFKIGDTMLGVFYNPSFDTDIGYWVGKLDKVSYKRNIWVFDFADMEERSILFSGQDKIRLSCLRNAIRTQCIVFQTIEAYYLIEEIYSYL